MTKADARIVFVVHGRNSDARRGLFQFLRSIGLQPLEWSQAVEKTGKASPYIGEVLELGFSVAQAAIILFTPDDEARLIKEYRGENEPEHETELTPQARQNVIFEAGMAMGLYPDRTIILELGALRPISDLSGRHVLRMNNGLAARQNLANRLKTAGCNVSLAGTDWHEDGSFNVPVRQKPNSQTSNQTETVDSKPVELSDTDVNILKLLAENNGIYLEFFRTPLGLHTTRIKHHLEKLEEFNLVTESFDGSEEDVYYLTKEGRAYVVENDLI